MDENLTKVCRSRNKGTIFLFTDAVMYASERTVVTGALVGGTHKFHPNRSEDCQVAFCARSERTLSAFNL